MPPANAEPGQGNVGQGAINGLNGLVKARGR
jgi:hypothetical protein